MRLFHIEKNSSSVGIVLGVDEGIDSCKAQFFYGLISEGSDGVSPILFPFTSPNAITAQVSIAFGIRGENITVANGRLSSGKAIAYSIDLLTLGKVDTIITGGVTHHCAAILVLEDFERAIKRGARIYGEIVGYGEEALGASISALTQALDDAELLPDELDCLLINDDVENSFGDSLSKERIVNGGAVSSAKAAIEALLLLSGKIVAVTVTEPNSGNSSLVINATSPCRRKGG